MPTYEYRCKKCDTHLEVVQSFTDDPLTKHAKCGGELRKVFAAPGIAFKGSGFYKTDSRGAKGASSSSSDSSSENGSSSSSSEGSSDKSSEKSSDSSSDNSSSSTAVDKKPSSDKKSDKKAPAKT